MSSLIYLSLKGKVQGLISAGCNTKESIGNKFQHTHKDEILVYNFQHMITRQDNTNHQPVIVVKPIDKSSPLLAKCITNNEEFDCLFSFYRTNENGGVELYYKIKLGRATLASLKTDFPHSLNNNSLTPQEILSIKYKDITWINVACSTESYSIWDERVY
ncbi:Hemolysin-coregulated protein [Enterobacterales bacterium 8AC]|nr:Hemolysin-coregulated protein [Enterobacterales bacterium 8AC]